MANFVYRVNESRNYVWDVGTLAWVVMTQPGGSGGGGTSAVDNAAFTPGASSFTPIGGEVDDTGTTAATENSAAVARITPQRAIHVNLRDNAGSELSVGGGTQYDRDTVAGAADKVNMTGVVRSDAGGTLVNADGDRSILQVDANGALRVTGGGGGTEFVEDAASPANPTAAALSLRRRDALAAETTTDGDWVTANATNKGELYVKQTDVVPVSDNAGSLTVDNPTLSVVGGGTEATALRVTLANDSTGLVSVDDNGGSLTVDGTVAVSGSVAVTNVGTFAVQDSEKVTDNAAFTDGTTKVQPAGFIFDEVAGTALTENDAAAARVDSKRAQVLVIEDATTRGQRATVSAANALKVDGSAVTQPVSAASLPLPTGASTLAEQQTQTTSLQLIDDTVHANDAALGKVAALGAQFDDVSPGTTTENNVRALRMSTRRELYGQIRDAAGNERGANVTAGNALVVDGSAVTQPVSNTVLSVVGGGTEAAAQRVTIANNSTGVLAVTDNGGSLTVDGTVAVTNADMATVAGAVRAEDAASADGQTGIPAMAVRKATPANTSGADGDYEMLQVSAGRLWVDASGKTLTVDGSAVTQPVSHSTLAVVGGGTEAAALRVTLANDSTGLVSVDDNGGSLTIDGTVAVSGTSVVDERRGQTVLFAKIDTASSGDQAIVAADGTKKIKVLSYVFVSEGSVNVKWRSATTDKSGAMPLIANTGVSAIGGTMGSWLLETAVNEALNLNLSAGVGVRGHISYFLEA